jgi:hypothetical protein
MSRRHNGSTTIRVGRGMDPRLYCPGADIERFDYRVTSAARWRQITVLVYSPEQNDAPARVVEGTPQEPGGRDRIAPFGELTLP